MSYKRLPDDALYTIYDALGRDFSETHFGMPAQNSKDQSALVAADRNIAVDNIGFPRGKDHRRPLVLQWGPSPPRYGAKL